MNPTSSPGTDEQLLEDIRLTEKELDAYSKISEGFAILATLPEAVKDGGAKMHHQKHMLYMATERRCNEFLGRLRALKEERGL